MMKAQLDALSDILGSLSLSFSQVGTLRLSTHRAIRFTGKETPAMPANCLFLLEGKPVRITRPGTIENWLFPGDALFLAGNYEVVIGHSPTALPTSADLVWNAPPPTPETEPIAPLSFVLGEGGEQSLFLGVAFGIAEGRDNPLVNVLPEVTIVHPSENSLLLGIISAIRALISEYDQYRPGYTAMARTLAEAFLVCMVRHWVFNTQSASTGWLRGLLDPKIALALSAIHKCPAEPWTLSLLAQKAGMSRTAFSVRFRELVGQPPIEYLTSWRMHLARCHLRVGNCSIAKLADELGYSSEALFRQNFKRHCGILPSKFAARPQHAEAVAAL